MMQRNLNHRVEVVFPVEKPAHIRFLRDDVLHAYLKDNVRARVMQEDGSYLRLAPEKEAKAQDIQDWLMKNRPK
jgi:polyphosphate kinase